MRPGPGKNTGAPPPAVAGPQPAAHRTAAGEPYSAEQQLAAAFEQAPIGVALIATDGRRLRVNQALCDMLGRTRAELLARHAGDDHHPDDREAASVLRGRLLAGHVDSYQHEARYLHRRGDVVWGQVTVRLVRDAEGQPHYSIAQVLDITERKRAEQALRESESRFRSLAMLSSDWYWEQDAQFRFTHFRGMPRDGAWRPDENSALGRCRWELPGLYPLRTPWHEHRAQLEAHQPFRDFEYTRRDLKRGALYLSASGEPVFDERGRFAGYRGTVRDITDAKLAEQQLRDTQSMLHLAAQIGQLGAWALDRGEPCLTWSQEACAIHDVRPGLRPTLAQAIGFLMPEYRRPVRRLMLACLREGTPFDTEAQIVTAKGRRLWIRIIAEAEWDAAGRVRRLLGACQDISAGKAAAEANQQLAERLNAELEQRVRERTAQLEAANQELKSFSYSIAHDLRAPLSSIEGFGRLLEEAGDAQLGERSRHYLRRIRAGVRQMGELTDGLLALTQLSRTSLRHERVDLAHIARSTAASCRERAPDRAVDWHIADELPVMGDPRLLTQMMANLVGNAWKFTGKTPAACIEIGSMPGDGEQPTFFVRDNGAGFDMAYATKLFEAFHRMHTAAEFDGNGIGLAIVHKIVARHGGRVWAQSAPLQGATFFFTLPDIPAAT